MAPLIVLGAVRGTGAFGGRARAGRDVRGARGDARHFEEKPDFTKTP